jgi:alpha-mannosidase
MEKDSPRVWKKILEKAKEGRWEINGVMWLEPDITNPSGESLVRQILYGVKYFREHMGSEFNQTVLFLPDCFGFSAAVPQILCLGRVEGFVTAKISWSEYTKFPHTSFQWRGIDGSTTLVQFVCTPSGGSVTYNGGASLGEFIGTWNYNKEKNVIREAPLHIFGHGDGGGGVTEDMLWNFNLYEELPYIEGLPTIKHRNLTEIFVELAEKIEFLPVWDNELYLEYHRGTLTTFEEIKRQNRDLESHLHNVEWLMTIYYTLTGKSVHEYFEPLLEIWQNACLWHFHDCIPGSAINEANTVAIAEGRVNLTTLRRFEQELGEKIVRECILEAPKGKQFVFNTLSHKRILQGMTVPSGGWVLKDDKTILEIDAKNTTQYKRPVGGGGYHIVQIPGENLNRAHQGYDDPLIYMNEKEMKVETPFFIVEFNPRSGNIKSVIDKSSGAEYLTDENAFELYNDCPSAHYNWNIDLSHKEEQLDNPICTYISFDVEHKTVRRTFETVPISTKKKVVATIEQNVTFSSRQPFIDFSTHVNWTLHDKLLKVAFPTNLRNKEAKFGIQFGHITRPTHNNTVQDLAKFEVYGRWTDLGEDSRGLALMSECKGGFDVHDGVVRMSLLKSSMYPDRWQDYGVRKFIYRSVFHGTSWDDAHIPQIHDELVVFPVVINSAGGGGKISRTQDFVLVEDDWLILDTLKVAEKEDGFVCRFYDAGRGARRPKVTFPLLKSGDWKNPVIVDLHENPMGGEVEKIAGDELSFYVEAQAFQVVTLKIERVTK